MPGDILKKRKIAVLGSRSVGEAGRFIIYDYMLIPPSATSGKSSLVIQFTENQFIESYYPTIENTFTKSVSYKGVDFDCDIIDTAGQVCTRVLHVTPFTLTTSLERTSILSSIQSMPLESMVSFSSTRSPREIPST